MKTPPDHFPSWNAPPCALEQADRDACEDQGVADAFRPRLPPTVVQALMSRKVNPQLAALRMSMPYVPVTVLPNQSKYVIASTDSYVETVTLPSDAEMVRFYGPSGVVFFVSFNAAVTFPVNTTEQWSDGLVSPIGEWFYCRGKSQVSIGLPFNGQVVAVGVV